MLGNLFQPVYMCFCVPALSSVCLSLFQSVSLASVCVDVCLSCCNVASYLA